MAQTADDVHARLTLDRPVLAIRILLRLIAPGWGSQDTRRPAARAELDFAHTRADSGHALERLAAARLLTLDDDSVDLAHEALLTSWPRLRRWIEEGRERLRAQRRLTGAAHVWDELDRDPGALYRSSRLAEAIEQFGDGRRGSTPRDAGLTALERDFRTASRGARLRERRRLRWGAATLCALLVLALLAGVIAWQQTGSNDRQHTESEAHRGAAVADSMRMSDPVRAMRLSAAAWRLRLAPTLPRPARRSSARSPSPRRTPSPCPRGPIPKPTPYVSSARTAPNAAGERHQRPLPHSRRALPAGLPPPRGGAAPRSVGHPQRAPYEGAAPRGRRGPVRTPTQHPRRHQPRPARLARHRQGRTPCPTQDGTNTVAHSRDGRYLAAGDDSGRVTLWDGRGRHSLGMLAGTYREGAGGKPAPVSALAFCPDGSTLAVAGGEGTLRRWDSGSHQPLGGPLPTGRDRTLALAFSPGGGPVYAAGARTRLCRRPPPRGPPGLRPRLRRPDPRPMARGTPDGPVPPRPAPDGPPLTGHP